MYRINKNYKYMEDLMVIYPRKTIYTLYIILGTGFTFMFGIAAMVNFIGAVRFWIIFLGITILITRICMLRENIRVKDNKIIIKEESKFKIKKTIIYFDEIAYIQEINVDNVIKDRFYKGDNFAIYLKGRKDLKVYKPYGLSYLTRDLRKLFLYLEKEHNVKHNIVIKQRRNPFN